MTISTLTLPANVLRLFARSELILRTLFDRLAADISIILTRAAMQSTATGVDNADIPIPPHLRKQVRDEVSRLLDGVFLGRDPDGKQAPFFIDASGAVVPLSMYMRILWPLLTEAVGIAVDTHAQIITQATQDNPAAWAFFRPLWEKAMRPLRDMLAGIEPVAEIGGEGKKRPIAAYEPPHTWVDPNGYTLSERIWNTDAQMRASLDAYLNDAIRAGKGSLTISREVEKFLNPGQLLPQTNKPYGRNVSYNAMRLARTEISSAYNRAAYEAARLNPYISRYYPVLSRQHPEYDICDDIIAMGPFELEDSTGVPPFHPNCLCRIEYEVVEDEAFNAVARAYIRSKLSDDEIQEAGKMAEKAFKQAIDHYRTTYGWEEGEEPNFGEFIIFLEKFVDFDDPKQLELWDDLARTLVGKRKKSGEILTAEQIRNHLRETGLTDAEIDKAIENIKDYTKSGYSYMRKALHTPEFGERNKQWLKRALNVEDTIRKLPVYDGPIYRVLPGKKTLDEFETTRGIRGEVKIGGMIQHKAMASFSHTTENSFWDRGSNVLVVNQNKSGVAIEWLSDYFDEHEVLVPTGSRYKVVDIKKRMDFEKTERFWGGSGYVIYLEEIL